MAYQVDGGGGLDAAAVAAARAKAAEEAARRQAEEAAQRAAEEAAQRQAKEAASHQAAKDASQAEGAGRYAAYAAPEEVAPPPKPPVETLSIFSRMMTSLGKTAIAAPALGAPLAAATAAFSAIPSPAGTPSNAAPASNLTTEVQDKMNLAKEMAGIKKAARKKRLDAPSPEVRAENAKAPIKPEHEYVFNTLNPKEQQAFKELSPSSRENFFKVYEKIGGTWAEPTKYSKEASAGMRKLLQHHRLEAKDTTGQNLIDVLAKRADQKLDDAMTASTTTGTLQSVIKQLAYPERVYQGENTNTCASAALQGILATEDPGEFARIATGLVFDGQVKLQGGGTLKLDASQVGSAQDGDRSALSQALQTSFDTFAKQFPAESESDFGGGRVGGGGRYGGGRVGGGGRFGGGKVGGGGRYGEGEVAQAGAEAAIGGVNGGQVDGGGLTQSQIEKLYENVAGRLAVNIGVTDANRFSTLDGVAAAIADGQKVPVGVQGVDNEGNATHHMITVLDIKKDAEDPGNDKVVFTDPGTGEAASMAVKDFAQILQAAIIPAQFADHMRWNVAPNATNPFGGGRAGGGGRTG